MGVSFNEVKERQMVEGLAYRSAKYDVKGKINGGAMSDNVTITIKNKSVDYIFYVGEEHDQEIMPGNELGIPLLNTLTDERNQVILTFDRCEKPTVWRTYGLGEGFLECLFDPVSGKYRLYVSMTPPPDGPQETPAPTFEVSGDITGTGQDNWTRGMELVLQGSNVNQMTLSITE